MFLHNVFAPIIPMYSYQLNELILENGSAGLVVWLE